MMGASGDNLKHRGKKDKAQWLTPWFCSDLQTKHE
jgi:hypothetical protein